MKLYHYAPKENTVLKDGLFAVCHYPEKLKIYARRANSYQTGDILKWLDSTFPGRSRSIACLTEPIHWQNNDFVLKKLMEQSELFSFDLDDLLKDNLVESIWIKKGSEAHGEKEIFKKISPQKIDISPLDWQKVNSSKGLIYGVIRHYFIVLKDGKIIPKYLKKEDNA